MHHTVVPSVNVFIIENDQLLLGRRANTGWLDGKLCAPGGHVEKGETPKQAMIREIQEELGVKVHPDDLEFVCVAARNTSPNEYVAYEFVIRNKNYQFTNCEPEKCSELAWVTLNQLPSDVIDDFKEVVNRGIIGKQTYLEIGFSISQ